MTPPGPFSPRLLSGIFFLMGRVWCHREGHRNEALFFFPHSTASFPREPGALNAKRRRRVFKRQHWIDPPEQLRTFPSNLGSIHLAEHSAQVPPPESKEAHPISAAASNPPEPLSVWLPRRCLNSGRFRKLGGEIWSSAERRRRKILYFITCLSR